MILLPTPSAADGAGGHLNRSGERSGELLLPGVARAMGLLPTPLASDGTKGERWAEYADAIHQWETLTRPAPDPTVLGRTGKPQLSATAFGAVASATDLAVEATFIAGGLGVAECPMVPGTHWCAACEGPRRAAAAEAVPF